MGVCYQPFTRHGSISIGTSPLSLKFLPTESCRCKDQPKQPHHSLSFHHRRWSADQFQALNSQMFLRFFRTDRTLLLTSIPARKARKILLPQSRMDSDWHIEQVCWKVPVRSRYIDNSVCDGWTGLNEHTTCLVRPQL